MQVNSSSSAVIGRFENSEQLRTLTAALGCIGALIMFAGDLLLYANYELLPTIKPWVRESLTARITILQSSDTALNISVLLGPIAALFYLGGSVHIALIFRRSKVFATLIGTLSAAAFIASGAYHSQFGIFGHILKYANSVPTEPTTLVKSAQITLLVLNNLVQILWLVAFVGLFAGMLAGWTVYSRKLAWLSPIVPVLILVPLVEMFAGGWPVPWGSIAAGGIYNFLMIISFAVFFVVCRSRH